MSLDKMQPTFGDAGHLSKDKRTRKAFALAEMDQMVPWSSLVAGRSNEQHEWYRCVKGYSSSGSKESRTRRHLTSAVVLLHTVPKML
ncbi:MAG: hypothetical protein ACXIUZ_12185 [Lysobacteraceae bacterium]